MRREGQSKHLPAEPGLAGTSSEVSCWVAAPPSLSPRPSDCGFFCLLSTDTSEVSQPTNRDPLLASQRCTQGTSHLGWRRHLSPSSAVTAQSTSERVQAVPHAALHSDMTLLGRVKGCLCWRAYFRSQLIGD